MQELRIQRTWTPGGQPSGASPLGPPQEVRPRTGRRGTFLAGLSHGARRLAADDRGQDLVEYALLTAFLGVAVLATWIAIENSLATAYAGYDSGIQNLWEAPAPGAGQP